MYQETTHSLSIKPPRPSGTPPMDGKYVSNLFTIKYVRYKQLKSFVHFFLKTL